MLYVCRVCCHTKVCVIAVERGDDKDTVGAMSDTGRVMSCLKWM